APSRHVGLPEAPVRPAAGWQKALALVVVAGLAMLPLVIGTSAYLLVLLQDVFIAALFALSLHFIMGLGGMTSFGHAAYFGIGAYAAALLFKSAGVAMVPAMLLGPLVAGVAAMVFGAFCVRLSGVYLAMLSLAFGRFVWCGGFQWADGRGGSNGSVGIWPGDWLGGANFHGLMLGLGVLVAWGLRRVAFSPFGHALRAGRDSPLRADA